MLIQTQTSRKWLWRSKRWGEIVKNETRVNKLGTIVEKTAHYCPRWDFLVLKC